MSQIPLNLSEPLRKRPSGVIKKTADDFVVEEVLDLSFTGTGEHAYFFVQKVERNTQDVVREIAGAYGVPELDVGFAGRKDKRAITRQWFSVCTPENRWLPEATDLTCLSTARHRTKLRRGAHQGNRFDITIHQVQGCSLSLLEGLADGFPNSFGPQRFSAANLDLARSWILQRRRRKISRQRRGWHLSVLRSFLFNQVLNARRAAGNHCRIIDGDVVEDGQPTGPLWGRGRSSSRGEALSIEQAALADYAELCEALEYSGVDQARRKLFEKPRDLKVQALGQDQFRLTFYLPPGAYATSMLAHCLELEGS